MKIFLIRHAEADAEVPEGLGDEGRALTSQGRLRVREHFEALSPRMSAVTLVLTSPLVRAVQTAQLLAVALAHEGPLKAHRCLLPDVPVGALDALLAAHPDQQVALVGHAPAMGAMAAWLLGLKSFPKNVSPGTVIGIERGAPGRLLFYAPVGQAPVEAL